MDYSITNRIFAHRMITPPDRDTDSIVNFTFKNFQYLDISPISQDSQSILQIRIENPKKIHFKHLEDNLSYREFKSLLLAMNLCVEKACITSNQLFFPDYELNIKPTVPTTATWHKDGNEVQIEMKEVMIIRDHLRIGTTTNEVLDEKKVIDVFKGIQNFELSKTSNQAQQLATHELDIAKSLSCFVDSMEAANLISKFKNMYESLELIVNSDGQNRSAAKIDTEITNLSTVPISEDTKWRDFNNRTKHVDKGIPDIQTYIQLKGELQQILPLLRQCCNNILLLRLSRNN